MARNKKTRKKIDPVLDKSGRKSDLRANAKDRVGRSGKSGRAKRGAKKSAGAKRSGALRRFLAVAARRSLYWGFVIGLWGAIGLAGLMAYYAAKMPSATTWAVPERPPNVKILSTDGGTLANRGATGGEALTLASMSPYIPQAVIAIEDRRFYSHFGVDPIGLARAMVSNLMAGGMVQGGSTLTQQLAKNLFLSPERTIERKAQEVMLAFWLEQKFTKDQILEMYLNRVYFGSGAYGVEAASRRYFKKSARDVNLAQAALLAGLLKAPSRLSPARDPDAAEARAQLVLEAMREEDFVTDREITTAMTQAPTRARSYWSGSENYAADLVMDRLEDILDGKIDQDLIVDTTIDHRLQRHGEAVIQEAIAREGEAKNVAQGALVSIDGSGAIRALIGGFDYTVSQFNRASTAKRQPGSAFKPFVYVAAMEMGRTPETVRNDTPVRIGKWTPSNYDDEYRGPVTLSEALTKSLNTIAAQLVMEAGPRHVVKTAHRMGIESRLEANASIALGTSEVTLTELTAAYAPFMNGGYKATPHIIRRVRTASGKVLYENTYDNPPRVLRPQVAGMMNSMLMRVVSEGTGRRAALGRRDAAGKTGTTQSFRDALFVGYTANLTTGVWFGNDDGTPTKKVTGGTMPAEAWRGFMTAAHEGVAMARLPVGYSVSDGGSVATPAVRSGEDYSSPGISTEQTASTNRRLPPATVGGGKAAGGGQTTLLEILLGE
ncbi:transglycosylase domain-containing protein [Hoeflea sp. CAU 1731]